MPEWVALGDRAIRFPRPSGAPARALVNHVKAWPDVVDVVVARDDVAVYFADAPHIDADALDALGDVREEDAPPRVVELLTIYDAPDLADVARAAGMSEEDVVRVHAAGTYTVETMGFAPGFAYLTGLDPRLHLPRRETPRTRVPAGSIAIAGGFTSVYPFDSPGGWHLIGRVVGVRMFDENGARLQLGDSVRFVP